MILDRILEHKKLNFAEKKTAATWPNSKGE